jgi:hypothetical protein
MEPKALAPAKINPTKLLGGSIFSTKKINTSNLIDDTVTIRRSDLSIIKGQVIEVKNLIKSSTLLKQAELERKRKEKEKDKFTKKETGLEAKKEEPGANKVKVPGLPKLGFLDRIKNIIFTVLLGRFIVKMLPNLPKLVGIVKAVSTGVEFAADFAVGLINALGTFIQKADEASIQTRKFLKTVGGDNTVKLFDGFTSAIDKVIEASIIAALAVADLGGDGKEVSIKRGFDRYGRKVGTEVQERYLQRYGEKQFVGRFGQKALQRVATRGAGQTIEKGLLKTLVKRIPIVGGLLDFALNYFVFKEPLGESAFRAAGSTLVSVLGGAIGSIFPGPGTIVGAALGGVAGDALASTLYDMIFKNKVPTQKKVQGRAQGGPVTRGGKLVGGPAKRGVSKTKKRGVTAQPTKLKPGVDIGGQKNIEKVFPSPTGKDKDKQVNPLEYIKKSYDRVSKAPFFGPLLSLTTKALSGQKPSQLDYFIAAQGINNWMNITFSSGVLRTGGAFAGGGEANAEMFLKGEDLTQVIAKSLEDNASQQLEGSIQDLMKQMMLKPSEESKKEPSTGQPSVGGEYSPEGIQGEIYQYLLSKGLDDNKALGIMANIFRESGFRPGVSESGGPGVGLFQYSSAGRKDAFLKAVPDYATNWKGQIDFALKDDVAPQYLQKQFSSPQEAADWWMREWERPAEYIQNTEGPRIHREYLASLEKYRTKKGYELPTGVAKGFDGYITGDPSSPNYDPSHGGGNYHDHLSFKDRATAERAYKFFTSKGFKVTEFKGYGAGVTGPHSGAGSLHHSGLAFDIPGYQWGGVGAIGQKEYSGSAKVREALSQFRSGKSLFGGGLTGKGGLTMTHPGEYIIDKDSVDAFGIDFFDIINQTESVAQRKNSAKQLMSILQFYAGYEAGGRQKIKVKVPAPQVSYVTVPVPIGGGMVMTGSSSVDSDYDSTYAGH